LPSPDYIITRATRSLVFSSRLYSQFLSTESLAEAFNPQITIALITLDEKDAIWEKDLAKKLAAKKQFDRLLDWLHTKARNESRQVSR